MDDFESEHCPVCHKPVTVAPMVSVSEERLEQLGDTVYVPGDVIPKIELTEEQLEQRRELEEFLNASRPPGVELEV